MAFYSGAVSFAFELPLGLIVSLALEFSILGRLFFLAFIGLYRQSFLSKRGFSNYLSGAIILQKCSYYWRYRYIL